MSSEATVTPPQSHLHLLEKPLFAHMATVGADGAPLVNPMWFLWDSESGTVKLTHTRYRRNYQNFKRDPRLALSITDPDDQYRYIQVRGIVEREEADPEGEFYNVLAQRYRGHRIEVRDKADRVILHVRPTGFKVR